MGLSLERMSPSIIFMHVTMNGYHDHSKGAWRVIQA